MPDGVYCNVRESFPLFIKSRPNYGCIATKRDGSRLKGSVESSISVLLHAKSLKRGKSKSVTRFILTIKITSSLGLKTRRFKNSNRG